VAPSIRPHRPESVTRTAAAEHHRWRLLRIPF
jgi:hypothetical protein